MVACIHIRCNPHVARARRVSWPRPALGSAAAPRRRRRTRSLTRYHAAEARSGGSTPSSRPSPPSPPSLRSSGSASCAAISAPQSSKPLTRGAPSPRRRGTAQRTARRRGTRRRGAELRCCTEGKPSPTRLSHSLAGAASDYSGTAGTHPHRRWGHAPIGRNGRQESLQRSASEELPAGRVAPAPPAGCGAGGACGLGSPGQSESQV